MNEKPNDADRAEAMGALAKAQFAVLFAYEMREKAGEHAKQIGVTEQQILMAIDHGTELYKG